MKSVPGDGEIVTSRKRPSVPGFALLGPRRRVPLHPIVSSNVPVTIPITPHRRISRRRLPKPCRIPRFLSFPLPF
jgi:hypothetical protein